MLEAQEAARLLKALEDPDGARRVEKRISALPKLIAQIAAAFFKTSEEAYYYSFGGSHVLDRALVQFWLRPKVGEVLTGYL